MNTFIRTAACLLLSVGLAGALVSYEAYCKACVKESQQASLFPHPNRCDQYIQCDVSGNVTRAYLRACPPSTFFNMTLRICALQVAHCNETCKSGSRFKAIGSCNNYYECVNGKFDSTQKSCPDQFAVDPDTGACVADASCPPRIVRPVGM
ncbi:protein PIF [Octopus bimaculoides]|uniref:Chitin-binding type-2 domain-containing protein n=1 Tax=Octopus bimaculoides TaxID=37653 RepID=A0A0L8HRI7_OCTBM|nr:protein PIF [Octopus bimaculoides]|eukprot:XP_014770005.1 PREDICTED: protein PIF-like [Octopus bimaculoides]